MARHAVANGQLRRLMNFQRTNGVQYTVRYTSSYVRVVKKFFVDVAHSQLHKQWFQSFYRAMMTDEVKVDPAQWLAVTARLFLNNRFHTVRRYPRPWLIHKFPHLHLFVVYNGVSNLNERFADTQCCQPTPQHCKSRDLIVWRPCSSSPLRTWHQWRSLWAIADC